MEPTSYQWHCKQFQYYVHTRCFPSLSFSLLPISLVSSFFISFSPSFIRFPSWRHGTFFARFNYDFKVCARHHMNVNDCGHVHCYPAKCIPTILYYGLQQQQTITKRQNRKKAWMNRLNRSIVVDFATIRCRCVPFFLLLIDVVAAIAKQLLNTLRRRKKRTQLLLLLLNGINWWHKPAAFNVA